MVRLDSEVCLPRITHLPVLLALVVTALSGRETAAQSPAGGRSQQQRGTAVIRGRVLAADTGLPLRRALISCSSSALGWSRAIWTDAQGLYEISGLAAGRYALSASKAGYLLVSYGQIRTFQSGKPIDLKNNEILEHADLNVPRGGA